LLLEVVAHPADVQDRDGAKLVFEKAKEKYPDLQLIWADGGYRGKLIEWTKDNCDWTLEIVKRSDDVAGFEILPRRWVVERTFGWLNRYRRLSKDYEAKSETTEALIKIAMIQLMINRLAGAE
jgi:putative transposase